MTDTIDDIKNLLKIYPNDVVLLTSLGKMYFNDHSYVEAINTFKEVIEINPEYSVTYQFLGKTLMAVNNSSDAEKIYIKGRIFFFFSALQTNQVDRFFCPLFFGDTVAYYYRRRIDEPRIRIYQFIIFWHKQNN